MAEPVTLYPVKGGDPIISVAPSETQRLLATGAWSLAPTPEPEPEKPKQTSRKTAAKEA